MAENPEHTVHFRLQRGRVIDAMDKLSAEQQEAVTLAYFKGFTHTEIASHLSIPLGTIKSRIRSGMAILRGILRD